MRTFESERDKETTDQAQLFDVFYGREDGGFQEILPVEVRLLAGNMRGYGKALDLGCGDGRIALFLANAGYDVTGIDVSQVGLDRLERKATNRGLDHKLELVQADIRDISLSKAAYDIVVAVTVLDHIPKDDLKPTFEGITQSVRQGGILFAKVHNVDDPGNGDRPDASELRSAIKHYFLKGELAELAEDGFEILTYTDTKEKDTSHGKPHRHAFSTLLARRH